MPDNRCAFFVFMKIKPERTFVRLLFCYFVLVTNDIWLMKAIKCLCSFVLLAVCGAFMTLSDL